MWFDSQRPSRGQRKVRLMTKIGGSWVVYTDSRLDSQRPRSFITHAYNFQDPTIRFATTLTCIYVTCTWHIWDTYIHTRQISISMSPRYLHFTSNCTSSYAFHTIFDISVHKLHHKVTHFGIRKHVYPWICYKSVNAYYMLCKWNVQMCKCANRVSYMRNVYVNVRKWWYIYKYVWCVSCDVYIYMSSVSCVCQNVHINHMYP